MSCFLKIWKSMYRIEKVVLLQALGCLIEEAHRGKRISANDHLLSKEILVTSYD